MQKVDARSISSSAQEHLRQLAVKAVLDGKKQKEVAELFGITPQTVCIWVKAYRLQGQGALNRNRKAGRREASSCLGRRHKLPRRSLIITRNNSNCLFQFRTVRVALLIKRRFGLKLSVWTIGRYLKRWGFYPAETGTASLGRKPGTGSAMAGEGVPPYSPPGTEREGPNILGR